MTDTTKNPTRATPAKRRGSPTGPISRVVNREAPTPPPLVRPPLGGAMQYVTCRAMQHCWHHQGIDKGRMGGGKRFGAIPFLSVCTECGTVRTKWINRRGDRVGAPEYDRSACPGYSEIGEEVKHSRQEWVAAFAEVLFRDFG